MANISPKEEQELKNLGARIRQLRKEKGYTSHETFAYQNDISRGLYGKYERGENDLRYLSLLRIVKGLDMSLADFFSEGFDGI